MNTVIRWAFFTSVSLGFAISHRCLCFSQQLEAVAIIVKVKGAGQNLVTILIDFCFTTRPTRIHCRCVLLQYSNGVVHLLRGDKLAGEVHP